jgi:hypothetical protein
MIAFLLEDFLQSDKGTYPTGWLQSQSNKRRSETLLLRQPEAFCFLLMLTMSKYSALGALFSGPQHH